MKFTQILVSLIALPAVFASVLPRRPLAAREISHNATYKITNVKASKIVVDLSAGDNKTVIGYPDHDGDNQKWLFTFTQNAWTIKNKAVGTYLAPADTSSPTNGTGLVASDSPFIWDIWHDETQSGKYRIFVPNTPFNLDLTGYGNSTPGNPIQTWKKYKNTWQIWTIAK